MGDRGRVEMTSRRARWLAPVVAILCLATAPRAEQVVTRPWVGIT